MVFTLHEFISDVVCFGHLPENCRLMAQVLPLSCICRTPVAFVKATVNIALDLGMRICVSGDPHSRLCRSYGGAPFDHTTSSSACFDPWQS